MDLSLMDRLQILNYDEELRKEIKMKPMSRHYFVVAGNPGEQFHVFTSIAAWLLRKLGRNVEQPQEDDDPNFTISTILDNMRELDISVDFSPNKLKQGYGEFVIYVLDRLAQKALKSFEWKALEIAQNDVEESIEDDGNDNVDDEQDIEEEEQVAVEEEVYSDDSEDGAYMNGLKNDIIDDDLLSTLPHDESLWSDEVAKVAPALKVRVAPNARDWRSHLQQLVTHKQELNEKADSVGVGLSRISTSVARVLEATRAREQLLAARVPSTLVNLRSQYERTLATYKNVSGGVTQRQEILNELTEKVEAVKQKTEMKGSAMNDTSPIINIKKSLVALKKELQQMDLQLAVLMWIVIDKQSKYKKNMPIDHIS